MVQYRTNVLVKHAPLRRSLLDLVKREMTKRRANNEGSLFFDSTKESWCAEITLPNGKRRKKRGKNQKEVQDWLFEQRKYIQSGLPLKDEKVTVAAFMTRYMEEVAAHTLKPGTLKSYDHWVNAHIIPEIGRIKLAALRPEHLQRLYAKKLDEGLSKRTVQYMHSIIRRILNQAVRWGVISINPTNMVTPPKPEKQEFTTLSADQAKTFIESVEDGRWRTIYVVAILTGLRKSEILGLRWEDVDFKRSQLSINNIIYEVSGHIYSGSPKTDSSRRTIAMPNYVAQSLQAYQEITHETHGLIFTTSTGKPISQRNLTRHFHGALEKAGLPRIRFHDLRHTAATLLLKENVHPKVVQEMLGHSSISLTLDTYSHVIPSMQQEAADKMDGLFKS